MGTSLANAVLVTLGCILGANDPVNKSMANRADYLLEEDRVSCDSGGNEDNDSSRPSCENKAMMSASFEWM